MKGQIRIVFLVALLLVGACADTQAQDLLDIFLPKEVAKVKVATFVFPEELKAYEKFTEYVYYRPGRGVKEKWHMIELIEMESTVFKDTTINIGSGGRRTIRYDSLGRVVMILDEFRTMPANVWYDTCYYNYGADGFLQSIRSTYGNFGEPMFFDELKGCTSSEMLIHREDGQVVSATETYFDADLKVLLVCTYHFEYKKGLLVEIIAKHEDRPFLKYTMKY